MKLPGPDHPIAISANPKRVQVRFAGKVVADTTRALTLTETTYKPVHYIPREDADMERDAALGAEINGGVAPVFRQAVH